MNVGIVTLRVLNRPWPLRELAPMVTSAPRLFAAGTRVEGPAHNDYVPADAPADLTVALVIAHDNRARPTGREAAAQEYRRERRRAGIEAG